MRSFPTPLGLHCTVVTAFTVYYVRHTRNACFLLTVKYDGKEGIGVH